MNEWLDADKIIELSQHYKAPRSVNRNFTALYRGVFYRFFPLSYSSSRMQGRMDFGLALYSRGWGQLPDHMLFSSSSRKCGRNRILLFLTKKKRVQQLISWVEQKTVSDRSSFSSVFLSLLQPLLIFPRAYQI